MSRPAPRSDRRTPAQRLGLLALLLGGLALLYFVSLRTPAPTSGRQAPGRSSGATVSGPARVLDGDTLVIGGTHLRLYGIDAPEHDQTCVRAGPAGRIPAARTRQRPCAAWWAARP